MSVIGWIVLGLFAGLVGSKIVNGSGEGLVMDIALGVVGALAGGWLFKIVGHAGIAGFNLYSMFVAVIGSVAVLFAYRGFFPVLMLITFTVFGSDPGMRA